MSFDYSQEVTKDYEKLLESDEEYNVIIYAGEGEEVKEIHAHSNILRIRSQYFRTAFSNESTKKKDGKFIFNFPNISPQFFKIILRFIYCGKINLENLKGPDILKLLIAVDEFKIQSLILCIQEYLTKHQHQFLQQNPMEILETVYQHEVFTELWNYCLEEICAKPDTLFKSDKFINLKAPLLELLLKRDDLSLDEIVIWDNLIKWCFSQHPSIQKDVKKWNKEEIVIMERTIHRFIPLIRFYHIPSADFIAKVYPFKKVMPEDLIDNILVFHMTPDNQLIDIQPPRKPKCIYDTIIVNDKHFAIFSSWIEKKNHFYYNEKNIPYNFNLLYRASRDGNTPAAFHTKCDNKGATIVLVKITNSEQIVGGYNPFYWNSVGGWNTTYDSFLFSFTDTNNLLSAKVSYSNGNQYSVYNSTYGPAFGGGHDLYFNNNNEWYSSTITNFSDSSYPEIGIPAKFKADDFEVFQIVKK
ncbi:hypothetical protein GLOIN_2v1769234 [Rhizophagus irregularis DAOM 181602=DAOM 197198]|uniref:Btb/poz domain-containing protein 19-like n=2 Tax=Rhizophagus irregularis TaxID=588596 RepID=U9ULB4_RHIID|nr:hypothetical protein GLOIN_2v1769234 [Rhizophagus irregularis DAOM 181602=DAOM 197198]EXX56055.1 hypothetical protein RirG_219620 [Rhizophagus irregularis DAOM 197198w]POG76216.1 hypothetical protein GLOIN_2v1769234 [Rhizophagus irregularis DAOM 181602=DAOM 197198]|eukprot:XP_025183082.1 hypothetical protein GLOIN_2v1769234 [Rhizophagus irregularis DAOM 181602=DAOM 197198]